MSSLDSEWSSQEILVIAKAYPEISTKSGEIVCTAGITKDGQWRRIYPVPFRDLEPKKQFRKWQWIKVLAKKHTDPRPESFKIQSDSIEPLHWLAPGKHLDQRKQYICPGVYSSLHEIEAKGLTLGAFKPKTVIDLTVDTNLKQRTAKQQVVTLQQALFTNEKSILKVKPLQFIFKFSCNDSRCKGHKLTIIDWEIHQTYFNFLRNYGDQELAIQKLKEKWFESLFKKRNTYFIAGTHSRFNTWMLIGYFSLGLYDSLEQFQRSMFLFDKDQTKKAPDFSRAFKF